MNQTFTERNKIIAFLVKYAFLAFFVRCCISAIYYHIFIKGFFHPLYAFDGEAYSIDGWYIALVLRGVNVLALPIFCLPDDYVRIGGLIGTCVSYRSFLPPMENYGIGLYSYILGGFYYIFGYAPVLARFFMSGISIASALVVYLIARRIFFDKAVASIAYVCMLFFPSFIIYSASLQRDTLIVFFILLVVYVFLRFLKKHSTREAIFYGLVILSALRVIYYLRMNAMFVLCAVIVCYFICQFIRSFRWLAVSAFIVLGSVKFFQAHIFSVVRSKLTLMLNYHIGLNFLGGSTFKLLPDAFYRPDAVNGAMVRAISLNDLSIGVLRGLWAFLFEPSPFSLLKISQYFVMPHIVIWYAVVLFACFGIWRCVHTLTPERTLLMLLVVFFSMSIGLSEANYETLLRHRDMIAPIYIIFAAYGMTLLSRIGRVRRFAGRCP